MNFGPYQRFFVSKCFCDLSLHKLGHFLPLLLGVAPFSGATTGTGGRIRDVQAAGRGAHVVAGTAGYCFGNLHIPGEEKKELYHCER